MRALPCPALLLLLLASLAVSGQPFQLPTPNRALFAPGGEEKYFAPTPGKTWLAGTFGCVRSDGHQLHEGVDILWTQQDKRSEPTDPVTAAAAGTIAYINRKPSLSNYGNYLILRHRIEGLDVCTLYAHLASIRDDLQKGDTLKAGEKLGIMGRTTNTKTRIAAERAHLHFEIILVASQRYAAWHETTLKGLRNDHGNWKGRNLLGLDPRAVLLRQRAEGDKFSLVRIIHAQTELCRVLVKQPDLEFARQHRPLVRANPATDKEGIAAYELVLNFNGIPCQLIPRAPSEVRNYTAKFHLLSVNDAEQKKNGCRKFLTEKGGKWALTPEALQHLDLLTH
ncbi:MAG: M23 family metallopeptidase [Verrucomicrobia bacterium]|nr:M23 family metallopeptidase [Verrucomicrobiota bacterium]